MFYGGFNVQNFGFKNGSHEKYEGLDLDLTFLLLSR